MGREWPALDVTDAGDADLLLAAVDECGPTALEERDTGVRLFFATPEARDAAVAAAKAARYTAQAVEVPDEDWGRRSQQDLQPITVGRITIVPGPEFLTNRQSSIVNRQFLVIPPSMAFGTGHHATTRMCLAGLQTFDLSNARVLDVGTGSGVLAIASVALGAEAAIGIDHDPDAVAAARENLALNRHVRGIDRVTFSCEDLRALDCRDHSVVVANLTGTLLAQAALSLTGLARPGGRVVLSGILSDERDAVLGAFGPGVKRVWQAEEGEWVGLVLMKNNL